ncbi:hypothetical protein EYW49_20070 [Siculibacillus lacustris]|uniref:Uncharacterized protein n=1 Tax=Siculibacillus lacustris TaxID=1549641 RepID=A0A4Q9VFB4_9HYPH|nr:hypothetical protein [Siculibacillus lacustris]TBW33580.1 hypothetical protein EYW49_20070 [Siculibacillus lacustris]
MTETDQERAALAEWRDLSNKLPSSGNIAWKTLVAAVGAARGSPWTPDPAFYVGHQVPNINMNSLDRIATYFRDEALASPAPIGFVIANSAGDRFRAWGDFGPEWTEDKAKALKFADRESAEAFGREDEDAWFILPIGDPEPATETSVSPEAMAAAAAMVPEIMAQSASGVRLPYDGLRRPAAPLPAEAREIVARAIKTHIKVDATGLAPAVASAFVVGINDAADAATAALSSAGLLREPVRAGQDLGGGLVAAPADLVAALAYIAGSASSLVLWMSPKGECRTRDDLVAAAGELLAAAEKEGTK